MFYFWCFFLFLFSKQVQMYLHCISWLQCHLAPTVKLHWTFGMSVCRECTFLGELFLYPTIKRLKQLGVAA